MPTLFTTNVGLRVLVEELPHTHSVSLGCFIGVGARHEPWMLGGVSHFIEHMCFKGTTHFPTARSISQAIEGLGGMLNASTSYESTVYWGKVADIHFERLLAVIADLVIRPLFDRQELEKERKVIIEEIRGIQDDPDDWAQELLHHALWGDQPLGRDIAGSIESVTAIGHAELMQFWRDHYTANNMVLSVAGNINAASVQVAIEEAFAALPSHGGQPFPPTTPALAGPGLALRSRKTEQAYFCIGFLGLAYTDPDRRALQVLDTILGGGMTSRLFQTLREDHGLAYDVGSYHSEYTDAGTLVIYAGVETVALRDSLAITLEIVHDLAKHGITADELTMVKEQVKGGVLLSLEDTWSVASRNGSHMLRYGEVLPITRVVAEVEAVQAADVERVARRLLRLSQMHVAVVGPYDADDQRELMQLISTEW